MKTAIKKRMKNKIFWIAVVAMVIQILAFFGITGEKLSLINGLMIAAINVAIALGIIIDPTTPGISDELKDKEIQK